MDRSTYERYRLIPAESLLRPLIDAHVALLPEPRSDARHAQILLNDGLQCPFLTPEHWCAIQLNHGHEYLSQACAGYPRSTSLVAGRDELSLQLSCPEAARLVLLDRESLGLRPEWVARAEAGRETNLENRPIFNSEAGPYTELLHSLRQRKRMAATPSATSPCLAEIRAFTFLLLQDRAYPLWQRLFLLGLFCRRLQTILDAGFPGSIPSLIANYAQVAASGALRSQMSAIPAHPGSQLAIILSFLNMRLTGTLNSLRFLECGKQFLDGIQYRPGTAPEDLAPAYTEAFERYYEPLMRSQPYMMENYLLNHVFKSVFPYGKAAAVETLTPSNPNDPNDPKDRNLTQSPAAPSVFREYLILCAHHALIKGLLIGMAGFHRENFGPDHVVRLVQSYGRMIEHHGAFPAETVAFLEAQSLANPSGIAMLLRNQGL